MSESPAAVLPDDVVRRKVDAYSEGTRLTAYVHAPRAATGDPLPTIVMGHGWGGVQSLLQRDAAAFAQAGYLAVTFDYRGWGESDARVLLTGPAPDPDRIVFTAEVRAVREVVDPIDMSTDWLNMIHWVHGEPQCDTARIGIWGSSMAGGYVIHTAAHEPRVKAVHSQVTGTLDGRAMGRSQEARAEATRRARGQSSYPEPGVRRGGLRGLPVASRFADYVPIEDIRWNAEVALQVVLSETEEYLNNEEHGIRAYQQHRGPKNLVVIPGISHYDIYGKAWQQAHELARSWFDRHLKGV
jgi:uncharacterized protein